MKLIKKKIHSYLLLELLIAIALLGACLGPLLNSSFTLLGKQKKDFFTLHLHLEAEKYLIELEEELRTGAIPWASIADASRKELSIKTISLTADPKIKAHLSLKTTSLKQTPEKNWIARVVLKVKFTESKIKSQITLFVEKRNASAPIPSQPNPIAPPKEAHEEKKP